MGAAAVAVALAVAVAVAVGVAVGVVVAAVTQVEIGVAATEIAAGESRAVSELSDTVFDNLAAGSAEAVTESTTEAGSALVVSGNCAAASVDDDKEDASLGCSPMNGEEISLPDNSSADSAVAAGAISEEELGGLLETCFDTGDNGADDTLVLDEDDGVNGEDIVGEAGAGTGIVVWADEPPRE